MPAQAIALAAADGPATGHWNWDHHLAAVAARHCQSHNTPLVDLLGGVACGACWELAIRDDERVVVECGLTREITPDPFYLDEVAVDLAVAGHEVALTELERNEVSRRLAQIRNRHNVLRRFEFAAPAVTR